MEQRVNVVTLAVEDVDRSRAFFVDGLGWEPAYEAKGEGREWGGYSGYFADPDGYR